MTKLEKHELLDRTYIINQNFDMYISSQVERFSDDIPSHIVELVEEIENNLGDLYQAFGKL